MKPARFQYARPETLDEALALLAEHGADAAVLAGGQSLMPMLNLRLAAPSIVVDINRIPELDEIRREAGSLRLGGRARHNEVLRSEDVRASAPLLRMALKHVAHEAIRNRGTLGGSLALADPAAELPACAVCLDATITARSTTGRREIAAADFFQGLYTTALQPGELLEWVTVPVADESWRFEFDEVARRHGDFALVGLAFAARMDGTRISECRVVFTGIEPSPRRITAAEDILRGAEPSAGAAGEAAAALRSAVEPMDNSEYPPDYKLHLAGVLLTRALSTLASTQAGQSKY
jgi:carbon-monoxide dehydrogenase medium subunit